jgi:GT2 family glycosyltransferase
MSSDDGRAGDNSACPAAAGESRLTVVIPTYNRSRDVMRALDSLELQSDQTLQVIVVDNASTDDTGERVAARAAAWGGRLRCIRKKPEGPAAARQLGLMAARTPFVLFQDSDVQLEAGWIERALARLQADPSMAAIGGHIVYAFDPSRVNAYGGELNWFGLAWDIDEGQLLPPRMPGLAPPVPRVWINCSAMLARRTDLIASGGFDTRFFYGYEDTDLGWRMRLLGRKVMVSPELVARHHVEAAPGLANPEIVFHANKNRLRMMWRNTEQWRLPWVLAACLGYMLADMLLRAPREPKWRALKWNWSVRAETRALRAETQRSRHSTDASIFADGTGRWLPPSRLGGLRRRAVTATSAATSASPSSGGGAARDDRI